MGEQASCSVGTGPARSTRVLVAPLVGRNDARDPVRNGLRNGTRRTWWQAVTLEAHTSAGVR